MRSNKCHLTTLQKFHYPRNNSVELAYRKHWWIWGNALGTHTPLGPCFSILCSFQENNFQNNRLVPLHLGCPSGKSWICDWKFYANSLVGSRFTPSQIQWIRQISSTELYENVTLALLQGQYNLINLSQCHFINKRGFRLVMIWLHWHQVIMSIQQHT